MTQCGGVMLVTREGVSRKEDNQTDDLRMCWMFWNESTVEGETEGVYSELV